ncbi:neutral zinc metallopeptidase [Arthrobacter sp. GCM10027362]|uniref:neutral zinc metallopeptidase n=1 Tax=Arthrobacter sp. GCM10027362 TaxID=3273379 RepID=UPI00362C5133
MFSKKLPAAQEVLPAVAATNDSRPGNSMKTCRRSATALATALLLVACGSGTQQDASQDSSENTAFSSEPSYTAEPTEPSDTPAPATTIPAPSTPPDAPTGQGSGGALQGSGQGLKESGIPADETTQDPAVVQAYTQYAEYVVQNLTSTWNQWFQQRGMPPQDVGFVIVPKGTEYKTQCHAPGEAPQPVTDEGSAFYCHVDQTANGRTGVIWLPLTSMIGIVNGDVYGMGRSQWPGDFAFAESIAHEFGHHVEASLEDWYAQNQPEAGVKPPRGAWNELLADCFAGNWTEAVYTQGILQDGDYNEAIAKIGLTGDTFAFGPDGSIVFNPSKDPHGAPNHRVGAYKVGVEGVPEHNYQPGDPQTCMAYYWHADMDYTHDMVLPAG